VAASTSSEVIAPPLTSLGRNPLRLIVEVSGIRDTRFEHAQPAASMNEYRAYQDLVLKTNTKIARPGGFRVSVNHWRVLKVRHGCPDRRQRTSNGPGCGPERVSPIRRPTEQKSTRRELRQSPEWPEAREHLVARGHIRLNPRRKRTLRRSDERSTCSQARISRALTHPGSKRPVTAAGASITGIAACSSRFLLGRPSHRLSDQAFCSTFLPILERRKEIANHGRSMTHFKSSDEAGPRSRRHCVASRLRKIEPAAQ